jgi:hypothetical protein
MKKLYFLTVFSLYASLVIGQVNFSGTYGYTISVDAGQIPKEITSVPGGVLVLLKMEGNQYRFWLDVLNGPPGFNRGETDGTITFKNDTASFDNTFEGAEKPCILKFKKTGKSITIDAESTSFNCGFGNGVNADGDYRWKKKQEPLDNNWLKKQYPQAALITLVKEQVELFRDENTKQPFSPKKYLGKGTSILNIAETDAAVYTELIEADGSFKYGWIRKIALN